MAIEGLEKGLGLTPLGQTHTIRRVRICRYLTEDNRVCIGLAKGDDALIDLSSSGIESITSLLESGDAAQRLAGLGELPGTPLADVTLLCPVSYTHLTLPTKA